MLIQGMEGIPLAEIEADIREIEADIIGLLAQVTGSELEEGS